MAHLPVLIPTFHPSDCGTRRWVFSSFLPVLWIRKYFLRIRGFVMLHYTEPDPGGQLVMNRPDPNPTKTFLWALNMLSDRYP